MSHPTAPPPSPPPSRRGWILPNVVMLVDVQGFLFGKTFVFKEVASIDMERPDLRPTPFAATLLSFQPHDGIIARPAQDRSTLDWMFSNRGPAPSSDADYRHPALRDALIQHFQNAEKVFVKGRQKMEWIRPYVPNACRIYDLEALGCPAMKTCRDLVMKYYSNLALCSNVPETILNHPIRQNLAGLLLWLMETHTHISLRNYILTRDLMCSEGNTAEERNVVEGGEENPIRKWWRWTCEKKN